jgi:hypothetical protein
MAHVVSGGPGASFDLAGPTTFAPYNPAQSTWSPYHFKTSLLNYGTTSGPTTVEVAPTSHGAIFRATFPPLVTGPLDGGFNQTRRLLIALERPETDTLSFSAPDASSGFVAFAGSSTANSGGVPAGKFGHHFYATVAGGTDGDTVVQPAASDVRTDDGFLWLYLDFNPVSSSSAQPPPSKKKKAGHAQKADAEGQGDVFVVRIATSLISAEQAQANHADEVAGVAFDDAVAAAKQEWLEQVGSRMVVGDVGSGYSEEQAEGLLTTFYSSLYRAAKYPRQV